MTSVTAEGSNEGIANAVQQLRQRLNSKDDFQKVITSLVGNPAVPLIGLRYVLQSDAPFETVTIGSPSEGNPSRHSYELEDSRNSRLEIEVWPRREGARRAKYEPLPLLRLFEAFWRPELRTESAGFLDLKRDRRVESLAQYTVDAAETPILISADLDRFGKINKQFGEAKGDEVIRKFGVLFERTLGTGFVPLHNGGDEFLALATSSSPHQVLLHCHEVWKALRGYDFGIAPLSVGVSLGCAYSVSASPIFSQLLKRADECKYQDIKALDRRGTTRFRNEVVDHAEPYDGKKRAEYALCTVRTHQTQEAPFASLWMNALSAHSQTLSRQNPATVREGIIEFLEWARLQPGLVSQALRLGKSSSIASAELSPFDTAFGIVHGLLRSGVLLPGSGRSIVVRHDKNLKHFRITWGTSVIWETTPKPLAGRLIVGLPWKIPSSLVQNQQATPLALLVDLQGYAYKSSMPEYPFFADTIRVDHRPTKEGGLPDFWEATLAQLMDSLERNPSIDRIYVYGTEDGAKQTATKLRKMRSWNLEADAMSSKTGHPPGLIRRVAREFATSVVFVSGLDEILADLAGRMRSQSIQARQVPADKGEPVLSRRFDAQSYSLQGTDGCRVPTLATAYPLVVEIVRNAEVERVQDQGGRHQKELLDFKVVLTEPSRASIPAFYASEEPEFGAYFKREFLASSGRFAKAFRKQGQLSRVIKHLASSIGSARPFSTRRAILIIPHQQEQELTPLGLVSVRCTPRYSDAGTRLHFTFVWRTVEALVGFPFSAFASVKFADHMTGLVKGQLSDKKAERVHLGQVTYIAQSLHMFDDTYATRIARRIVSEASD